VEEAAVADFMARYAATFTDLFAGRGPAHL